MRIHTLLVTGFLVSGLSFTIHAASISGVPGSGVVGAPSPSASTAVVTQIQNQLGTVEAASNALQQAMRALAEAHANKPQRPNTSGMSKEEAARQQARYAKALAAWQQKIKNLSGRVAEVQQKLVAEVKKLQELQSRLSAAQSKDNQRRRRAMERERARVRSGRIQKPRPIYPTTRLQNRKAAILRTKTRKTLAKSRKLQQDVARMLRRTRSTLRDRSQPRTSGPSATTGTSSPSDTGLSSVD